MTANGPGNRVAVFIDHSNFYNGLKKQFGDGGGKYELTALTREVARGRPISAWNHYCGLPDPTLEPTVANGQSRFVEALQRVAARDRIPLQLKTQPLMYPPGFPRCGDRKPQEKGIDALIVQDLIVGAFDGAYDVAVLLSGDRDFCNVVEFLKGGRFPHLRLETLFANTRRHLYDMKPHCFDVGRVVDKPMHRRIVPGAR